jgi:hypothetical protein
MPAVRTDKENVARLAHPASRKSKNNSMGPSMFPVGEKTEDLADCLCLCSMIVVSQLIAL